jgi:regulator of protease activity HflC (stomatin/prohibitin superfamily)
VELKAIDPPKSIIDAMEKQLRAERDKRATILTAEGLRQSQILTAEGAKQSAILTAEGQAKAQVLMADGQAKAIDIVFSAIHDGHPDPELLAYQYLQVLPKIAEGNGSQVWMIPTELTKALEGFASAFSSSATTSSGPAPEPNGPPLAQVPAATHRP